MPFFTTGLIEWFIHCNARRKTKQTKEEIGTFREKATA